MTYTAKPSNLVMIDPLIHQVFPRLLIKNKNLNELPHQNGFCLGFRLNTPSSPMPCGKMNASHLTLAFILLPQFPNLNYKIKPLN